MLTFFRGGCPLLVGCLLAASSASAQMVGASLRGTVTAEGGTALEKAKVEVREVTTGALWSITSNGREYYQAPLLPPRDYEIQVAAEGFAEVTRRGIHLAVGQDAVLDVALEKGQSGDEDGAWTAEVASVGLASAARSGLVDDRQIRDLPLNGRSFQQLAVLQTGVTQALAAGTDVVGGRAPKISVNGTRPEVNNITTLQSGHPFTVRLGFNRSGNLNTSSFAMHERPNVKPGYTNNPVLGGPDRYWDVAAFELPPANQRGNLGRNTVIGPGLAMLDLALVKSVRLGESRSVQFRGEVFNLPNRPNLAIPSGRIALTNAAGAVAPTWGRITSTVTTSRQVQLGLKLSF